MLLAWNQTSKGPFETRGWVELTRFSVQCMYRGLSGRRLRRTKSSMSKNWIQVSMETKLFENRGKGVLQCITIIARPHNYFCRVQPLTIFTTPPPQSSPTPLHWARIKKVLTFLQTLTFKNSLKATHWKFFVFEILLYVSKNLWMQLWEKWIWHSLDKSHNISPEVGWKRKWSNGVGKSEMIIFWCISITNKWNHAKKINGKAQTAKFIVFTRGHRWRQELFPENGMGPTWLVPCWFNGRGGGGGGGGVTIPPKNYEFIYEESLTHRSFRCLD